ncbi:unnamed protein product [Polarella glacialis]|uniref:Uncharacterized protein n=1 Tax=Polarella glacialis TaxID=89957 RepID=A0A813EQM5_POLGL|nr:unnamed protein product [Polarella glacialis]CAE8676204.1 unnamed protein product [Polarella glacialis]
MTRVCQAERGDAEDGLCLLFTLGLPRRGSNAETDLLALACLSDEEELDKDEKGKKDNASSTSCDFLACAGRPGIAPAGTEEISEAGSDNCLIEEVDGSSGLRSQRGQCTGSRSSSRFGPYSGGAGRPGLASSTNPQDENVGRGFTGDVGQAKELALLCRLWSPFQQQPSLVMSTSTGGCSTADADAQMQR